MSEISLDELRIHVRWSSRDAANLRVLGAHSSTLVTRVADGVYEFLAALPGDRAVFLGSVDEVARQRQVFAEWLANLLDADLDAAHFQRARRVGIAHVRSGIGPRHILTGMEIVRQEFDRAARASDLEDVEAKLHSLQKLLAIEQVVMVESYREHYAEKVRRSERSAVEERLTRAEHLAEIGQLAASLAHEIKNPLAGISAAIQIIRESMSAENPHRPVITEIIGQIKRLDATVKDLLQYAKPVPPRFSEFPLAQSMAGILEVLRGEPALQGISVTCRSLPPDVTLYADDAQITQLIINLLLNAAHASRDGGDIELEVHKSADRVELLVKDTGKGMTREVMDQAFEPFFTTKAKGTGLGLPICKRIVEAHGGSIALASEIGKGTTVTIRLPRRAIETWQEKPA
ncbi:MAG: hypothetical protein KJ749_02215 [Planctomycetes bacterium]|nr:hypothetical protein [Planctomycetota bacterium]